MESARCSFCDDVFMVVDGSVKENTEGGKWLCSVCRNIPAEERERIEREEAETQPRGFRFFTATERMINDLRAAGHTVECPVTGSVWVDGVEITPTEWDRLSTMGDVADVLEYVNNELEKE